MEKLGYTVKMVPKKFYGGKMRWDYRGTMYLVKPFGFEQIWLVSDVCKSRLNVMSLEEAKSVVMLHNDTWAENPHPYFGVVEVKLDENDNPIGFGEEVH